MPTKKQIYKLYASMLVAIVSATFACGLFTQAATSITVVDSGDTVEEFRVAANANFASLNSNKIEIATSSLSYGDIVFWSGSSWDTLATSSLGLGGSGTVTSVNMTVPTGLSISGGPITTSGTFALTLTGGYNIPKTASTTSWEALTALVNQNVQNGSSPSFLGLTLNSVGYSFPGADGSNGQCLKTNGSGTLSWGDCSTGSGSGTVNSATSTNIAYYDSTGNTVSGTSSISILSNGNVGIGSTSPTMAKFVVDDGSTATTTWQIGDGSNTGGGRLCLWNANKDWFDIAYIDNNDWVFSTSSSCNIIE